MNIENCIEKFFHLLDTLKFWKDNLLRMVAEKIIRLLSTLMLAAVLSVIGLTVFFHLSFVIVFWLAPYVGSIALAHAIVMCGVILTGVVVYLFRRRLIISPIKRFVTELLMK